MASSLADCDPTAAVEVSKRGLIRAYGTPCSNHGFDCSKAMNQHYVLSADSQDDREWNRVMSWEEVCEEKNFHRLPSSSCYRATIAACALVIDNGLKVQEIEEFSRSSRQSTSFEDQMTRMSLADDRSQVEVSVVRSTTYSTARIEWSSCLKGRRRPDQWMIVVTNDSDESNTEIAYFYVHGNFWYFDLPLRLASGAEYTVDVKALKKITATDSYSYVVAEGSEEFCADFTMNDLDQLYEKACEFAGLSNDGKYELQSAPITPCYWFYRNRSDSYFRDIMRRQGGIMKAYTKDDSGDPASPINRLLEGLFFMAKNVNGQPPAESAFGPTRLQVPANVMLNKAPNLYFADFYCMRGKMHTVTVVITRPFTEADEYCQDHLLPLYINENPFLFRRGGILYTANKKLLNVEVFYTENVNIHEMLSKGGKLFFSSCPTPKGCKGHSSPRGIPKNPLCETCNIRSPISSEFPTL